MQNMLLATLPHTVEVRGFFYKIRYEFDIILRVLKILESPLWTKDERVKYALDLFYVDDMPDDKAEAFAALLCFIDGATLEEIKEEADAPQEEHAAKIIDFEKDANFIYTAFLRVYNIDLIEKPVHWWKFKVMLDDLGEVATLQSIVKIRSTKLSDVPEDQRAEFRKLKAKYALDAGATRHKETLEERNKRWKGEI